MKTVFSKTTDVIQAYLNGNGEARNSQGSVFARAKQIYSYGMHYQLAEIIDEKTIWVNDAGYSPTTNRHISAVERLARQKGFTVIRETEVNLEHAKNKADEVYEKWQRARKPEIHKKQLRTIWGRFKEAQKVAKRRARWLAVDFRTAEVKALKCICKPA